jgi:hypothetical protein
MFYQYRIIYSEDYTPDLTEVNALAQEGWELLQIIQAPSTTTKMQWAYLLQQKAIPIESPEQRPA